jgi:hypothetical protein
MENKVSDILVSARKSLNEYGQRFDGMHLFAADMYLKEAESRGLDTTKERRLFEKYRI